MMSTENRSYTAEQIEAIGGKRWTSRTGTVRIYLNDWPTLIDFEISTYGTGNISSASLRGEALSNTRAGKLSTAKVWWENGEIVTDLERVADYARLDVTGAGLVRALLDAIAARVAEEG